MPPSRGREHMCVRHWHVHDASTIRDSEATPQGETSPPTEGWRTMAGGLLLGAAAAALLTAALPAHDPSTGFEDPPPDKIVIKVATVNGSGCPAGTAAVA